MAEQAPQASEQDITDTLMYIHDEVTEAVQEAPNLRRMVVGAVTRNIWSMDINARTRLTTQERHNNKYLPIDSPMQDPYLMKTPIHLDLLGGRQANFVVGLRQEGCYFIDNECNEGISRATFLRLLGIRDEKLLWDNLKHRSTEAGVRKDTIRELTFWPLDQSSITLYAHNTATNGVPMSASIRVDSEVATDRPYSFEGTVDLAWSDGTRALNSYKHLQVNSESSTTLADLSRIGDIALSTIIDHTAHAARYNQ